MKLKRLLTFLLLAFVLMFSACDSCGKKSDPFDAAWSRLQPLVNNAGTDQERVKLLESFIQEHEGHPGLVPIQKQLDVLREELGKTAKVEAPEEEKLTEEEKLENSLVVYEAFANEGSFDSFAHFAIATAFRVGRVSKDIASIPAVTFTDVTGEKRLFEGNKNITSLTPRNAFAFGLRTIDKEKFGKCRVDCQNEFVSKVLLPITEKPLFGSDGSVQLEPLKKFLAKIEFGEEKEYGGLTAKQVYKVVSPSIDQALIVREQIREQGDDQVLTAFRIAKKEGRKTLKDWYKAYPKETGITDEVPEAKRRRVDQTLGFWIRRINEGTADPIEEFLKKFKENGES